MKRMKLLTLIMIFILGTYMTGCSKKSSDSPSGVKSVSFTFKDGSGLSLSDTSTNWSGEFKSVTGGNNGTNIDTTHGYVFSYSGYKFQIFLSFEIPQLASGTYTYTAFSPAWPMYLHYDQWMSTNQTWIYTNSTTITIDISRYSKGSLDATFSLLFNSPSDGANYISITNGKLLNVPVRQ